MINESVFCFSLGYTSQELQSLPTLRLENGLQIKIDLGNIRAGLWEDVAVWSILTTEGWKVMGKP
jgi:hypothetical protein